MASVRSSRAVVRLLERATTQNVHTACLSSYLVRQAATKGLRQSVRVPSLPARRAFSVLPSLRREEPPNPSGIAPPKAYGYQEIYELTTHPSPNRVLIDVREPSELLQAGRIPTAQSVPISSAPDAFFMNKEEFEEKFGFPRPGDNDEVIFYCRAGVRSRQAALLAGQARPVFGGKLGNYSGSWLDWEKNGGKVEKEGEQGKQSSLSGVTHSGQGTPGAPRP